MRKTCPLCRKPYRSGTGHGPAVERCRLAAALRRTRKALGVAKFSMRILTFPTSCSHEAIAKEALAEIRRAERTK